MIIRVPRELGRPFRLHRDCRSELRLTNSRLIHSSVPSWWGRTGDETMVTPNEGNEVRQMDGKESERLVVPTSQGNHPRDPEEGAQRS